MIKSKESKYTTIENHQITKEEQERGREREGERERERERKMEIWMVEREQIMKGKIQYIQQHARVERERECGKKMGKRVWLVLRTTV